MTQRRPFITIAIPTYNRVDTVSRRVDEFLAADFPPGVSLLVIDNHSPDQTFDVLTSRFRHPNVRILENESNRGFAGNFLRLIDEVDAEYLVVFSDEDQLHGDALLELMDFCRRESPNMVSPRAQSRQNPLYRGRSETRRIGPAEFESASFYVSGLTYRTIAAKQMAPVLQALIPANSAAIVYPQVLTTALLIAGGDGYFFDAVVSSQDEVHETNITEASGDSYNGVGGRWAQFKSFEDFFAMDHSAVVGASGIPKLAQMREQVRRNVLGLLIDAAIREVPELAPHLKSPTKRSFGGRVADIVSRFRPT